MAGSLTFAGWRVLASSVAVVLVAAFMGLPVAAQPRDSSPPTEAPVRDARPLVAAPMVGATIGAARPAEMQPEPDLSLDEELATCQEWLGMVEQAATDRLFGLAPSDHGPGEADRQLLDEAAAVAKRGAALDEDAETGQLAACRKLLGAQVAAVKLTEPVEVATPLVEGSSISGTVTGEGSGPLQWITVTACIEAGGGPCGGAQTTLDGTYTITGLAPGSYRIWFQDPAGVWARGYFGTSGFTADPAGAKAVTVPPDAAGIDVTLPLGHSIGGRVTKGGGDGLQAITAVACRASGGLCGSAGTAADGTYLIKGLAMDSYRVRFVDPTRTYVSGYYATSGLTPDYAKATIISVPPDATDVDALLPLGSRIAGVVRAPSAVGLAGIGVRIIPSAPGTGGSANTAGDGTYSVGGLWPGPYRAFFSDPTNTYLQGYYAKTGLARDWSEATEIILPPDATSIDVTLPLGSRIAGTVSGQSGPLSGINVSAQPVGPGSSASALSKGDGSYLLGSLWPGEYRVWFSDPTNTYARGFYSSGGLVPSASGAAKVTVPPDATSIDVELPLGYRISGTVTGPPPTVPPSIWVDACTDSPTGGLCGSATMAIDGTYQVGGLWPGTYLVRFRESTGSYLSGYYSSAGLVPGPGEATGVKVPPSAAGIDVQLPPGNHITGTVTGPTDTALSHISVNACPEMPGGECAWASVNADGSYSLAGLWPGTHVIEFWDRSYTYQRGYYSASGFTADYDSATPVEVPPDKDGIDVSLPLGHRISGTVTGSTGEPLAEISVSACPSDPANPGFCGWARTEIDGSFMVAGLASGSYRIEFWDSTGTHASGYFSDSGFTFDPAAASPVGVPPDANNIDVALPLGLRISGTVTGPSGEGVTARVTACAIGGPFCHQATASADGTYTVKGLNPGAHRVSFTDASGTYAGGYYSASGLVIRSSEATPVIVPPDASKVDVVLPSAFHISGRITDPSGSAIAGAWVQACPVAYGPCRQGRSGDSGAYSVGGLWPGSYRLWFWSRYSSYASGFYSDAGFTTDPAQATLLDVPPDRSGVDVTLPHGSRVRGVVTGAAGTGIGKVSVKACPSVGGGLCVESTTLSTGRYVIAGVAPGSYRISFEDRTGVHASGYYSVSGFVPDLGDASPVVVPPDAADINVQLPPGYKIGGTLTGPEDHPAGGVTVTACSTTGDWCWSSVSDGAGDYLVTGLVPGTYQVSLIDARDRYASGYYSESGFTANPAEATVLVVSPDQAGIDVQLPGARHIAGKVTGPGGVPLAGISVTACPMSGGEFCGHATTAADGTYSAGGLVRGMYEVAFSDPTGTYVGGFYDGSGIISSQSVRLKVSTENVSGIDVQTWLAAHPPTQYVVTASNHRPKIGVPVTVSAKLADARGLPVEIAGIEVTWTATGVGGELSATTSTTNAQGIATVTFTIRKAPGRAHLVTATDADGRTGTSPAIGLGQKP